mmetsp:Transcript_33862/g.78328  ORF Transcript_33862/g.78328 Transcript_33862/m.78328 type:complete len:386 (+) Transcript_33862:75-1232(+)
MAKGPVKGFVSKPRQLASQRSDAEATIGVSPVAQPGLRRKIFQEARSHLVETKQSSAAPKRALLKHAAESLTRSIREAKLAHAFTNALNSLKGLGKNLNLDSDIATVQQILQQLEANADGQDIDARSLMQVLEGIKAALSTTKLEKNLQEAHRILGKVQELEAIILGGSDGQDPSADLAQALQAANTLASKRSQSPRAHSQSPQDLDEPRRPSLPPFAGRKTSRGETVTQARRNSTRTELREMLRTSRGWARLPPPQDLPDVEFEASGHEDEGPSGGLRRRESWLKWWPAHCYSQGYMLHEKEAFFESLPKLKLNEKEMDLRDAIIAFVESKKGQDVPTLKNMIEDPSIRDCMERALPECVTLEDWVYRRQRLGRAVAPASRLGA